MIANNPAAVAAAFSSNCRPVSWESCAAAMPEPMTSAARKALPRYSASSRRASGCATTWKGLRRRVRDAVEISDERSDALVDVVARGADFVDRAVLGVRQVPVEP